MSAIKKTPAIEVILGRLNATQLAAVRTAINSTTPETLKSLVDPNFALATLTEASPTDIGTYQLQLDAQKMRNGVMIRVLLLGTLYEHFLVYGESQKVTIYEISSSAKSYKLIEEYCDINELRRVINDIGGEESHPGVFTDLEVEGNLKVDGTSEMLGAVNIGDSSTVATTTLLDVHGDAQVHGELVIDSLQNIEDTNGYPFIPDPDGHLKEALVHTTSGYSWYKGYELAGFSVIAKSVFEGEGFVYETHKIYFVWDDTTGAATYGQVYIRYYEA